MSDPNVLQLLGKIDGKLDQVIDQAKEHREDDKRRFSEVYTRLGQHDNDIAQAKGAKGVILWFVGGGSAAIAAFVSWIAGK
jgi:hypothetical protein